jgi:hypothetical protein
MACFGERSHIQRVDLQTAQPLLNGLGHELGTIVTADGPWHAPHREEFGQCVEDVFARDRTSHLQGQTFPRELVDDRQPLQRRSVRRPIEREVPAPHVILMRRPTKMARVRRTTDGPRFPPDSPHFQAFFPAQPMDPFLVHRPAFTP